MSLEQLKEALHLRIEQIDERFLKVMYAMAETYLKEQEEAALEKRVNEVETSKDWQPMTEEELMTRLEAASEEYKRGEYKTVEEIRKESEQW
jgi:hypothetical protein